MMQIEDTSEFPLEEPLKDPHTPKRKRSRSPIPKSKHKAPKTKEDACLTKIMMNYGSDEDESNDAEYQAELFSVPRAARVLLEEGESDEEETPSEEEEFEPDDEEKQNVSPALAGDTNPCNEPCDEWDDNIDNQLLNEPVDFLDFYWRSFPDQLVPPASRREPFTLQPGPTTQAKDPYELFTLMWNRSIVDRIVQETNLYAHQQLEHLKNKGTLPTHSRMAHWKDTNADEIYTYLAINMAMGVAIKPLLQDYWSTEMDLFMTPGFRAYMRLRRFQLLNKCLHFNNNATLPANIEHAQARLFKIQPVLDHLNERFQALFVCYQNLALDESLLQRRGCHDTNQSTSKAAAVGIKSYELCDSMTGYLWRFRIHALATPSRPDDPFAGGIPARVLELVEGLEYKGSTLWMDSHYNSPALARKLKSLGFDCAGTLRTSRQFVPQTLRSLKKESMRQGTVAGCTSGDVDILVWMDKNRVATLSTYHGNGVFRDHAGIRPTVVCDFNICMEGVDKKDQMLAAYPIDRKRTRVWYKKIFRRLLNVSVLNAFILHQHNATTRLTHRRFRQVLIKSMLLKHHESPVSIVIPRTPLAPSPVDPTMHPKYHHPVDYPFLPNTPGNRTRKSCTICGRKTSTYCAGCKATVCERVCFPQLHRVSDRKT